MVRPYNFGAPPKFYDLKIGEFLGVDYANYASEVNLRRSPDALNVYSTQNGVIEKRTGVLTENTFMFQGVAQRINGMYQADLSHIKSQNIVPFENASFLLGTTGWTTSGNVSLTTGTTGDTETGKYGEGQSTGSGTWFVKNRYTNTGGTFPFQETYTCSAWLKFGSPGNNGGAVYADFIVRYTDATWGSTIYLITQTEIDNYYNGGWFFISRTMTIDTAKTVDYVEFYISATQWSAPYDAFIQVSGFQMVAGTHVSPFGESYEEPITNTITYVHAGNYLYSLRPQDSTWERVPTWESRFFDQDPHYDRVEDRKSFFIQLNQAYNPLLWFGHGKIIHIRPAESFFIQDGNVEACTVDLTAFDHCSAYCKTPITVIGREPTGGGTPYEDINLVSKKRCNSFLGTAGATAYQLDTTGLLEQLTKKMNVAYPNSTDYYYKVTAEILQSGGGWDTITEGSGLTVDRSTGIVTFSVAPGVSPVTGMDNIKIYFYKENDSDVLRYSTANGLFGLNNSTNYLFTTNDSNRDYYGLLQAPGLYFPDLGYTEVGNFKSKIMGYSYLGSRMFIHKQSHLEQPTLFVRSATLDANDELIFPVTQATTGMGAIAPGTFDNMRGDPMFLTDTGVSALVSNEVTNINAIQDRSHYVSNRINVETGREGAVAIVYNDMYFLAINSRIYVADARKKSMERDSPNESFQYDWYVWEVPYNIRCFAIFDGKLWFGTDLGRVCRFKDFTDTDPYKDDAVAVEAYWRTPVLYMDNITAKKTLKNLWVQMAPYYQTSLEIYYKTKGREDSGFILWESADIFDFNDFDFERLSFNTDTFPQVLVANRVERQFMSIQFMFKNALPEPFGLIQVTARYKVNSTYKGG